MSTQETSVDALHQAGRRVQKEFQPAYPLLYSLSGFRHCDLRLAAPERAAWQGQGFLERGVQNEETKYPWESPPADLAAAEKLINDCGYHRRDEELADAKRAILGS